MIDQGVSRNALAAAVGCSGSSITYLLQGKNEFSVLVLPISEFLGIPSIDISSLNTEEEQALAVFRQLSKEKQEALLVLAETMIDKPE